MNKKKLVRNVSLVALSAVMVAGTAAAFAGCGSSVDPVTTVTVSIFCDATDAATNKQICDTWAKEYTQKLRQQGILAEDKEISVKFESMSDRDGYFTQLNNNFVRGKAADIVYIQPKNVKSWAQRGRVMDLSTFINASTGADYEENVANIQNIWQDVLAFYGYNEAAETAGKYAMGDSLAYYKEGEEIGLTGQKAAHGGFYTTGNGTEVGVYGLPKDYSNFTMGFNGRYFSDALKHAYTTTKATTPRSVKGAVDNPALNTYTGTKDTGVVTYAVDVDYSKFHYIDPLTGDERTGTFKAGEDAPLINIGIPTVYKPYNFYAFPDYQTALAGGDPVAKAVEEYTEGQGYVVTIPGFPGDTFEVPDEWTDAAGTKHTKDELDKNAPYDTNIGHVTFTYAEYGALTWAVTYFCNTFNFRAVQDSTKASYDADFQNALKGTSGVQKMGVESREAVFGNDQYEGAPNPTLYLLPWLAGNDANFINLASDVAINAKATDSVAYDRKISAGEYDYSNGGVSHDRMSVDPNSKGGTITEKVPKLRLNGEYENVDVQYGVNSQRFIETFGAFLAYGSDWNGNSGNARAVNKEKDDNGWSLFRNGACIFYGAGTWDNKTKNESPVYQVNSDTGVEQTFCEWRSMTVPVGEQYALYSEVKDAFYNVSKYSYGNKNVEAGMKAYTSEQIAQNQMIRQDKWGARMDSVGFALNQEVANLAKTNKDAEWKLQGCADLIMTLSADQKAQHDLCLGGAQLPNFKQQCVEFANYQSAELAENGSFSDMITPEGFSTTKYWVEGKEGLETDPDGVKEADTIWRAYLSVVEQLNTSSAAKHEDAGLTVKQFMDKYYPNGVIPGYKMNDNTDVPLRWDEQFNDQVIGGVGGLLTGELARRAAAMKVLKMTAYTYADRDMQLRMQYGVNAVRDSAMYTYDMTWINDISMRDGTSLTYRQQAPLTGTLSSIVTSNLNDKNVKSFYTPAFFCFFVAEKVQTDLEMSIQNELNSLR